MATDWCLLPPHHVQYLLSSAVSSLGHDNLWNKVEKEWSGRGIGMHECIHGIEVCLGNQ